MAQSRHTEVNTKKIFLRLLLRSIVSFCFRVTCSWLRICWFGVAPEAILWLSNPFFPVTVHRGHMDIITGEVTTVSSIEGPTLFEILIFVFTDKARTFLLVGVVGEGTDIVTSTRQVFILWSYTIPNPRSRVCGGCRWGPF